MKKTGLFLLLIIHLATFGQNKDPYAILASVKAKYDVIKDYTVNASIEVDVRMLNIPVKKVKVYYKYPDKIHVESKGFALLPKRAGSFNPNALIGEKYTAIYAGSGKSGNVLMDIIKTIPNETSSDVILTTFWIDSQSRQIRKMEINTKSAGTYQAELEYNRLPFDLPSKLTVVFDVREMSMPKTFTGEVPKKGKGNGQANQGKVTITYSDYRVNTGLDDKLFREKNK